MTSNSTDIITKGIEKNRKINAQIKAKKGHYYQKWRKNLKKSVDKRGSRDKE